MAPQATALPLRHAHHVKLERTFTAPPASTRGARRREAGAHHGQFDYELHGQAEAGAESRVFDQDAYWQAGADYIKQNNTESLTDEDIIEITRSNRQPIEELLQAARRALDGQADAPNPFDYLTGDRIKPKIDLPPAPNPNQYRGSSERYQQAKELVERFPQLHQLDFTRTKEQFDLFDGYEAIAAR